MSAPAAVRERPILFSGPMVRAILDGTKTQTRRVVAFPRAVREIEGGVQLVELDRLQPGYADGSTRAVFDFDGEPNSFAVRCPYGQPGDRLWVRETWGVMSDKYHRIAFAADFGHTASGVHVNAIEGKRWRPSIHMPRYVSRLSLEITAVRMERVDEISEVAALDEGVLRLGTPWLRATFPEYTAALDATAPGARPPLGPSPRERFAKLWDSLNAKRGYGWDANPWVWVVEFARVAA